jgi:NADH-quinone oxidoreductase subunit J
MELVLFIFLYVSAALASLSGLVVPNTALFYMFAATAVIAALRVIVARDPVHAVLYLVLVFFNVAGIWLLLHAEFLALALIMVYVGAVMVLLLFVVMMLDINIAQMRARFWSYLPIGAFVGVLMVAEMSVALSGQYFSSLPEPADPAGLSNTKALARLIFTEYVYPFELASVILLIAIIAAVMLTLRQRSDKKRIDPVVQIQVTAGERLQILKMPAISERRTTLRSSSRPGDQP